MTKGNPTQLSMFPDEGPVARSVENGLAGVSWSYSRRNTLFKCVRQYYYEYYGANKSVAENEPLKEQVRFLKAIQNRHERVGKILHTAISTYLRKSREGIVWDADRLVGWASSIFRKDIEYSRAHPDGSDVVEEPYPPVLLREYHYRDPKADRLSEESANRLAAALRSFYTEASYQTFRTDGMKPRAEIEKHFSKLAGFPFEVEGVVDLAFPTWTGATVVDWKTGEDDGSGDNSLQMAVYGLWAADYFACEPESLRICKAHLTSVDVVDFQCDAKVLAAARARIMQDAEVMQSMAAFGKNGIADAFSPCLQPFVCRNCSFLEVCPEGGALMYA